ncbi:MAG: thioredoxin domain-containing protein [Bacteroidales bacterium]|jgi:protein-disulfide isomerase
MTIVFLAVIAILLLKLNSRVYNTNHFLARLVVDQNKISPSEISYGPNDIIIGQQEAPVNIFVFTSYRCQYCADFFRKTFPILKKEYADKGIIKFIIKNIAYSNDSVSLLAAKAAYCAYAEGDFLNMNMKLLDQYDVLDETMILDWVSASDADTVKFRTCLNNKSLDELIFENRKTARLAGTKGTPAFIIGNSVLNGNRPVSKFRDLIELEIESCCE